VKIVCDIHSGDAVATILIVEDSDDNMKLFRTLLTLKGHEVIERRDGTDLLEILAREQPDLVLMDIQLPERDGFELLDSIRTSTQTQLKVVALTAHAMAGDRERALSAGFDDHITKPIDIRTFPEQVETILADPGAS
jgi:CheY-like chemotaxis protein